MAMESVNAPDPSTRQDGSMAFDSGKAAFTAAGAIAVPTMRVTTTVIARSALARRVSFMTTPSKPSRTAHPAEPDVRVHDGRGAEVGAVGGRAAHCSYFLP